jgi:hypothetical protein
MCSAIDRFLGSCGYMPPTTKFAVISALIAACLAVVMTQRS